MNFWQDLKKPFFVLAPMDDVTDMVFRSVVLMTARPDVFFTEFTNVEGLNSKGKEKLLPRLLINNREHPIVAQIWGKEPENYYQAAKLLTKMGFDGIDINMGCPQKKVVRNGSCAGLINNRQLAKEIILATQQGAGNLPVSVKTRLGLDGFQTDEWIPFLLQFKLSALTIHGRIAKQMSKFPANWEEIGKAVKIARLVAPETVMIGNGDIVSYQDGLNKAKQSGVDGVMIGRGIFTNPWIFNSNGQLVYSKKERLQLMLYHAKLFIKTWGETKNFNILKRSFKIYATGFPGSSKLRTKLMEATDLSQVEKLIQSQQP